jgi:hypothetical protein
MQDAGLMPGNVRRSTAAGRANHRAPAVET